MVPYPRGLTFPGFLLCYCTLGIQEEEKDEDKSIWFEITG
jgi:hypothetical protein